MYLQEGVFRWRGCVQNIQRTQQVADAAIWLMVEGKRFTLTGDF
jgi:hypothetical protein